MKKPALMRQAAKMALPDRLSTNPASPFHNAELLERGVGVKFNGVDRNNVEEYCRQRGLGPVGGGQDRRPPRQFHDGEV